MLIQRQTIQDFEIIIVDDASTDQTEEIVKSFDDPRIKYFKNDDNLGVGASRNKGNMLASGNYIAVMDDDDLMLEDRLEQQILALGASNAAGTYGGWIDVDVVTGSASQIPGKQPCNVQSILFKGKVVLHPTLMMERKVAQSVKYHESFRAGSDYNYLLNILMLGHQFVHCGQYVIARRIHDGNMTSNNSTVQKVSSFVTNTNILGQLSAKIEKAWREQANKSKEPQIPPRDIALELELILPDRTYFLSRAEHDPEAEESIARGHLFVLGENGESESFSIVRNSDAERNGDHVEFEAHHRRIDIRENSVLMKSAFEVEDDSVGSLPRIEQLALGSQDVFASPDMEALLRGASILRRNQAYFTYSTRQSEKTILKYWAKKASIVGMSKEDERNVRVLVGIENEGARFLESSSLYLDNARRDIRFPRYVKSN